MNPSSSNNTPPFSNRDLVELAALDAMGLLDETERAAYEKAFRDAPPAIQAHVRSQQLLASDIEATLPSVQPAASLRERVLAAVGRAISLDASPVAGRIVPEVTRSRGVASFWRAAAIGSMAAAILFGVVTVQMWSKFSELDQQIRSNTLADAFLKDFGPRFEQALMDKRTRFVQFNTTHDSGTQSMAVLLFDPETKKGQFFCKGLPADISAYTLSIVDAKGAVQTAVLNFAPSGNRIAQDISLDNSFAFEEGDTFVVRSADQSKTVLQSSSL